MLNSARNCLGSFQTPAELIKYPEDAITGLQLLYVSGGDRDSLIPHRQAKGSTESFRSVVAPRIGRVGC